MCMDQFTTKEASKLLGVSRRRVIALIEQGKLKARKFSNVYMIRRKDLEAVRERKNGRPELSNDGFVSFAESARDLIGSIKSGLPRDISNHKKYLIGFGTKESKSPPDPKRKAIKKR